MIEFEGVYYDGRSSSAHLARIRSDGRAIEINGEGIPEGTRFWLAECEVLPPLGQAQRSLRLPNGGQVDTEDHGAVTALEGRHGQGRLLRWVHALESRWRFVVGALVMLVMTAWMFVALGAPFLANIAARMVPPDVLQVVGNQVIETLDRHLMEPTGLPSDRRKELLEIFEKVAKETGTQGPYRLVFRRSSALGANAIALPSGTVILTDAMAEMFTGQAEAAGVFAHEIAHVDRRHGLRKVIQDAGVFLIISAIVGDVTSITSVAATLPTVLVEAGYSRAFEREADEDAGTYLLNAGWGTEEYRALLVRLEEPHIGAAPSFLATHPAASERVRLLEQLEGR